MKQFILVLILVTSFSAVRSAYAEGSRVTWAEEVREKAPKVIEAFGDLIRTNAERTGVSPDILFGLILVESSGNPDVRGGLMQAAGLAKKETDIKCDTRKPACSIRIAAAYTELLQSKYGFKTWSGVVLAYNLGPMGALKVSAPDRHWYVQRVAYARELYADEIAND